MLLVKKGNCECVISEDKLPEFLNMGYAHIDRKGNVIRNGKAQTKEDLTAALDKARRENTALRARVKELEKAAVVPTEEVRRPSRKKG